MQYILSRLSQLNCSRWNVTEHSFEGHTPLGMKPFTNIIATLDPHVDRRLVLAAHYDSKYFSGRTFLGATDSALPVALLIDLALTLDEKLQEREVSKLERERGLKIKCSMLYSMNLTHAHSFEDVSLQLIFTDGEEAFRRWSDTDSLYGARQLAQDMSVPGGLLSVGGRSGVEAIEAFVLLDLIGASSPSFHDMFADTTVLFQRIVKIGGFTLTVGSLCGPIHNKLTIVMHCS